MDSLQAQQHNNSSAEVGAEAAPRAEFRAEVWLPDSMRDVGPIQNPMTAREREAWVNFGFQDDEIPPNRYVRQERLRFLIEGQNRPKWQVLTGLHPKEHDAPQLRRKRLRRLMKVTRILLKQALLR